MKKIYFIILVAMSLVSCDKYLDIKPYGKTVPKTPEEFSALLHSHLNDMDEGGSTGFMDNVSTIVSLDAGCGDDFEACLTANSGQGLPFYVGNLVGGTYAASKYEQLYQVIRDCNIVIDNLDDDGTKAANTILATAYGLRAVCYYQLLRYFCEAPEKDNMDNQLGLALVQTFNLEDRPLRSSMQATVDFIEADLKKSINYHSTDALYRFTEPVCKGYLARLYFWTEQWSKVLPLTAELLKAYPILQINNYKEVMGMPFKVGSNQLIKAYSTSSGNNQDFLATTTEIKYRPVSIRFLNSFSVSDTAKDVRYKFYVTPERVAVKTFFCGLRSEELKLMQAESYYHLGKTNEALAELNDLRLARVKDAQAWTMATLPPANSYEVIQEDAEGKPLNPLISAILQERRKELFLEGDRFFELKRNGTPEFWTAYQSMKYTTRKYMYTFPIPIAEIEKISGLKQNPGYDKIITN